VSIIFDFKISKLYRHKKKCFDNFFFKSVFNAEISFFFHFRIPIENSNFQKAHNCVTSKSTISVDAISEKIKTIGARKIYYSKDLKPDSSSPINAFAINSDGYVVIGCIDNKSRILLYNPNGQLKKKADFDFYISSIGISDDRIFSAYYQTTDDQNKHEQLRIIAYDFDLIKTSSFTNNISYAIYVFYNHIDFCNNRVYLKVGTKLMGTRQSCQKIYVLDNKLNKIEQFTIDEPAELYDIKIRSDYITYYSVSMNTYTFHIKSLKTKKLLNKLDLKIDSFEHISFDTVSNGNVYVLIAKDSLLYEYDLFGKLIQTIKVRAGKSASNTLRMSENFNVAILSTDDKVLYLN
jgi:hypothetical protein